MLDKTLIVLYSMDMATRQVWISKSKKMLPVVEEALRTFPDAGNDSQALTRALFNWYYGRQEDSKRGALTRIEQKIDKLLSLQEATNES